MMCNTCEMLRAEIRELRMEFVDNDEPPPACYRLTRTECEIFSLLHRRMGTVTRFDQIYLACRIHGVTRSDVVDAHTLLKTHIFNIRRKLARHVGGPVIHNAHGIGYYMARPDA